MSDHSVAHRDPVVQTSTGQVTIQLRKVLGKLIHWIEIYPVDNSIHVLNNWGQALTYKNVKKLCFLNND